jgi:hypothetical protein
MKPYLIDVPVLLFVFVRPNTLRCVFDVIKEARPSSLFLVSDGPRINNPTDVERIIECRRIVEEIDWDCSVHHYYQDVNHGLYPMVREALDWVFTYVDRCIFLEDDVVPSLSFFRYCAELLERYKDDLRVNMICGTNHLGIYKEPNTDYFFSQAASIWGFALWRRTYEAFYDNAYGSDQYILNRMKENAKEYKDFLKALDGYYKNEFYGGHIAGPEFYLRFIMCSQNKVNILPKYNLIKNIGFCEGSTHAASDLRLMPKGVQKMFQMKTYEYTFPLQHPSYLVADKKYERKILRIGARNHPFVMFYRRCESLLRRIYYKCEAILGPQISRILVGLITTILIACGLLIFLLIQTYKKPKQIREWYEESVNK